MEQIRKPFQGVWNIIRFNWHLYFLSFLLLAGLLLLTQYASSSMNKYLLLLSLLIAGTIFISLTASYYIYDYSDFYTLNWLDSLPAKDGTHIINMHAVFDETSSLLTNKFPDSILTVLDFYDSAKHTEVSIKRARKAYPSFPGTQQVTATHLPLPNSTADYIFVIFAAHEIRNEKERIAFFGELARLLQPSGKIVVTEHLRNVANLFVYNIGAFHFYSKAFWLATFRSAHLTVVAETQITPFITTFLLEKNGASS